MSGLPVDVSGMGKEELARLGHAVNEQLKQRERAELERVRTEIIRLAESVNLPITFGVPKDGKLKGSKIGSVAPKFRHPTDESLTWTGRGRKPLWVDAHLKDGGSLESLMIKH